MVRLDFIAAVLDEPRSLSQIYGQDTSCQRVQRTGVAGFFHAENPAGLADDVMARHARRFQHIDDSIYHNDFSISPTRVFFAADRL